MKALVSKQRVRICPSDTDLSHIKRRAWEKTGPETIEVILQALRSANIEIPETPYEVAMKRYSLHRETQPRYGMITGKWEGESSIPNAGT